MMSVLGLASDLLCQFLRWVWECVLKAKVTCAALKVKNSWVESDCGRLWNACLFSSVDLQAQEGLSLYCPCICVVLGPTPIHCAVQFVVRQNSVSLYCKCVCVVLGLTPIHCAVQLIHCLSELRESVL